MKEMIQELIQYRHLLYMLTWRDIKIKYKQSVMGFLWAIFMPMMIVAAGIMVKKAFSMLSGKPMDLTQLASVSVKSIPWAFFVSSIRFATNSLVGNINLVTKIYFPREVFPLTSVAANFFDFAVASILLIIILAIAGIGASVYLLWLPVLLIILILLTTWVGMLLACANLFFRDVKYIVEVILTFGIFFTPVFYEVEMFGKWAPVLLSNPVGSILESINSVVVLQRPPNMFWLGYSALWAVGGLLIAWNIFHKTEFAFAENI
ncbi:MAG: ABC transporter permease [Thermodesulfobacteriota bacterium]|jgi:ABC-type polysaccharide/polyol phosphate export permease